MKTIQFLILISLSFSLVISSCSSGEKKGEKSEGNKDSIITDEVEAPAIEEVEMDYSYEVTNSKTKKTTIMSQEEYLQSGVWENPDMVIKEIPVVQ